MVEIELIDRSSMIDALNGEDSAELNCDHHHRYASWPSRHVGRHHADHAGRCRTRHRQREKLLSYARSLGVSVIHVKLVMRRLRKGGSEAHSVPFWQALQKVRHAQDRLTPGRPSTVNEHNLEGSPGTEIIPGLIEESDYIIDNKKRLDCFMGTDLDILLKSLGVRTICLMGINTNTCVLNTAFTAFNLNYQVVVLSDCVASMYGDDLHVFGLQNVARLYWLGAQQ